MISNRQFAFHRYHTLRRKHLFKGKHRIQLVLHNNFLSPLLPVIIPISLIFKLKNLFFIVINGLCNTHTHSEY